MSAMSDPFLQANPRFWAAIRHPHKTGEALEVMPPRPWIGVVFIAVTAAAFWGVVGLFALEVVL